MAIDGNVLALGAAAALQTQMATRGISVRTDVDVVGSVWRDQPALPETAIFEHAAPFAPHPRMDKLAKVREGMAAVSADWHLVSTLDDIAWMFNLRGADVSYNPVFVAHALIGRERATLFLDPQKVSSALVDALRADGVDIAPYGEVRSALAALPDGARLQVDARRMTFGLAQAAGEHVTLVEAPNPSTLAKALKTAAEAAHVRATMERDGAALCEFFAWFEGELAKPGAALSELSVDRELRAARARQPGFICESFGTIAGFNANGAMPHYRATPEAFSQIEGDGLLLIDSGGQYLGGTTDITRVVPIGTPSDAQKRDFTIVLKGTIALSMARFPQSIRSPMLDAIARAPLWAAGIDFGHGTGHGVGYFLNVHEGPQVISHYANPDPMTAMEVGMITSIEPGVYRPGRWGVRIENLVLNTKSAQPSEFGTFLEFETLTLCPIDTRCIVPDLLTVAEREWINDYHATVYRRVSPLVSGAAAAWLTQRTRPICQ